MNHVVINNIGNTIREKRKKAHLSMNTLSESTGIHKNIIINIELGRSNYTINSLIKICDYLGVVVDIKSN